MASSPAQPPQVNLLAGGWQKAIAVAGLSLLAGLGWYNFQLHQELAVAKQQLLASQSVVRQELAAAKQDLLAAQSVVSLLQQPNNRLVSLKSAPGKPMGKGSLVMIPDKSTAVLTLQQLAPLPKGQVYRVWAIMGDEEMACADFLPDGDKKVLMQIPLDRNFAFGCLSTLLFDRNHHLINAVPAIEWNLHQHFFVPIWQKVSTSHLLITHNCPDSIDLSFG